MKSLRHKVGVSYLGLVAITIAISGFAAYSFSDLGSSLGRILQENYGSVLAAENMVKELERQEQARLLFFAADPDQAQLAFMEHRDQFWRWYGEAVRGAVLPEEPALLDSIEVAYDRYLAASEALFLSAADAPRAGRIGQEQAVASLVARLRTLNFQLLEVNQDAMLATRHRVENLASTATTAVLGAALTAIVLSLLAGVYFARTFVRPIERLTRTVRQIREGHLDLKVDIQTGDEVEELGREFNQMTERLEAYEAVNVQHLIAEKKKSESLVEAMPSPVIVTDDADRVLLLNNAAIDVLGIHRTGWYEQPLSSVVPDEGLLTHLSGFPRQEPAPDAQGAPEPDHVFALPRAAAVPFSYYRRRQTYIEVEERGGLTVTVLEDVTRFKQLDQLKSDFLAAVSHELRTPLTSLGMAIDLLLQEVPGAINAIQRDLLDTARGDQARLKKLVSNLLDLARLEADTYIPASEPVHLASMVDEALAPLRLPFQEKGVALQARLPADLSPVAGEVQHLGWVVTNLAGNALRYTPAGGQVTVEAQPVNGMIQVAVHDTGSGIPPEVIDSIFDMFVQLKASNESTPGSLGLGLALARRVVEAHGGRIWAESKPGDGSTFYFTLPSLATASWNG